MILNPRSPIGAVRAMSLIFTRTVSIPRSSLLFSSAKFVRQFSPKSSRARAIALVVLPVPAGPANRRCGRFPAFTYAFRRETTSSWPTISSRVVGRYFSTQISCMSPPGIPSKTGGLYNSLCRGARRTGLASGRGPDAVEPGHPVKDPVLGENLALSRLQRGPCVDRIAGANRESSVQVGPAAQDRQVHPQPQEARAREQLASLRDRVVRSEEATH